MIEFKPFNKIYRYSREVVITEKLDGTNASVVITEDGQFLTGSRNRWITPEDDNYGFSRWANANKEELLKLGVGQHFGEWYGQGIQHSYGGAKEKRFALFNTSRWENERPACCDVVPVLYKGMFTQEAVDNSMLFLRENGSQMVKGFMRPEGIIIYHTQSGYYFKKTLLKDEEHKGALK